ncbi:MAG: hypothetical protein KC466_04110 [Myxococcales bacterium]|nr:hypothetical protein [Myxococcales bacterium]
MPERSLARWTVAAGPPLLAATVGSVLLGGELTVAPYPSGWRVPVLALELPANAEELRVVLDAGPGNRDHWRRLTHGDFVYPVPYAAFLVLVATRLMGVAPPGSRRIGAAAIGLVVAAAIADYVENVAILRALATPSEAIGAAEAAAIRVPAQFKWSLLALGLGASGLLAWRAGGAWRWLAPPAALMTLGLVGIWRPLVWEWAYGGLALYCAGAWVGALVALGRSPSRSAVSSSDRARGSSQLR